VSQLRHRGEEPARRSQLQRWGLLTRSCYLRCRYLASLAHAAALAVPDRCASQSSNSRRRGGSSGAPARCARQSPPPAMGPTVCRYIAKGAHTWRPSRRCHASPGNRGGAIWSGALVRSFAMDQGQPDKTEQKFHSVHDHVCKRFFKTFTQVKVFRPSRTSLRKWAQFGP